MNNSSNGSKKWAAQGCIIDVSHMRQIGVISFGGGINPRQAIADERSKGHVVSVKEDHACVYAR